MQKSLTVRNDDNSKQECLNGLLNYPMVLDEHPLYATTYTLRAVEWTIPRAARFKAREERQSEKETEAESDCS